MHGFFICMITSAILIFEIEFYLVFPRDWVSQDVIATLLPEKVAEATIDVGR